jgi:uncharacterized repeat protein (TIGR02543 family)
VRKARPTGKIPATCATVWLTQMKAFGVLHIVAVLLVLAILTTCTLPTFELEEAEELAGVRGDPESGVASYTVLFESNGGSEVPAQVVAEGSLVSEPPAPTREGHTFDGWYADETLTVRWDFQGDSVSADLVLYARWTARAYTVTFDDGGADLAAVDPSSITVTYPDTTVGALPGQPQKSGFNFAGWWTAPDGGGEQFTETTTVTADLTVYAWWSAEPTYTVTFESNGGTAVGAQTVVEGGLVTEPPEPTRSGYIFGGWYADAGLTTPWDFATNTVNADITLYARWDSYSYIVTFDDQGADITSVNPLTLSVSSPDVSIGTYPTQPAKTGANFAGWWTAPSGGGTQFTETTPVTGNITVYANWTTLPTYTVTFESNGGTAVGAQTVVEGGLVTEPPEPTRSGYIFGGWYADAGLTTPWDFATNTVNADITLYARWDSYSYIVTFDDQGADITSVNPLTLSVSSPDVSIGTYPTQPAKTGANFAGWWTELNGGGAQFTEMTPVTGDVTVYAYWTLNPTYVVTFEPNGGSAVGAQTVAEGGLVTEPADPTLAGYNFGGWFADAGLTTLWSFATDTVNADITLYAGWSEVYTVTYLANGATSGTVPVDGTQYSPSDTVTVSGNTGSLERKYNPDDSQSDVFLGWNTEPDGSGTRYSLGDTFAITGDTTLYAEWQWKDNGHLLVNTDGVAYFDGYAVIPYTNAFNPAAPFTIEFWLQPLAWHLSVYDTDGVANSLIQHKIISLTQSGGWAAYLEYVESENKTALTLEMYDDTNYIKIRDDVTALQGWHHFAITHDGTHLRMFRDGTQIQIEPNSPAPLSGSTALVSEYAAPAVEYSASAYPYIGQESGGTLVDLDDNLALRGAIDEIRIWGVARTAADIAAAWNTELLGTEPGLREYYRANEGAGTVLTDSGPNVRNGSLNSDAVFGSGRN